MENKSNLEELCRICLEHPTKDESIKVDAEAFNGITVLGMLVALSIEEDDDSYSEDDFPPNICNGCLKKLIEAYELQQTIVKSRKKLIFMIKTYTNTNSNTSQQIKTEKNDGSFEGDGNNEVPGEKGIIDDAISYEPCSSFCTSSRQSSKNNSDKDKKFEVEENDETPDDEELLDEDISYEPCSNFRESSRQSPLNDKLESREPSPFKRNSKLNKQQKIKITKLSKFECGLCDKVYADLKAFKIHFRKHTGERPYLCSFCSKTFADKSGLDKHVKRKHTAEGFKKHQCPYCPRKTCDITHLRTHIQTHTGEKPDICQICGKAFNGRTALRMHLRIHVDEKKFKCRFCDQAFKLKKYLERHEMIHQNIKPYQCHYCQSAFTQQGDMLKHLKQHDHDTSYKCDQCSETFRLKTELRRHMIVHPRPEVLEQTSLIK